MKEVTIEDVEQADSTIDHLLIGLRLTQEGCDWMRGAVTDITENPTQDTLELVGHLAVAFEQVCQSTARLFATILSRAVLLSEAVEP